MRRAGFLTILLFATTAFAGNAFDPDAATREWIGLLEPAAVARSIAYVNGGYWLGFAGFVLQMAIAAWLTLGGFACRLRDRLAARFTGAATLSLAYAFCFLVILTVLGFPLSVYSGYLREQQFGLSNQDFSAWLGDFMMSEAIGWVMGTLVLAGLYALVRRARQMWWVLSAAVLIVFMSVFMLIGPLFIAPLFNSYTSMQDGPRKQDILSLAAANGVDAGDVHVYDVSRQSTRITANVSGLFGTKRISLADNALERLSPAALRMVMAHEIGHFVLGMQGFLTMLGVYFCLVFWLSDRCIRALVRNGRWGIRGLDDMAGLPLAFSVVLSAFTILSPLYNAIVRQGETQADRFGINASREPDGLAEAALMVSEYRKIEPSALERVLFYDHPSGYERIHMAMVWKSAEMGAGRIAPGPGGPPPGLTLDVEGARSPPP